ncbi:MAG: Asp23/Gls24 family envelope stress response protein [Christensenellales bacterium]
MLKEVIVESETNGKITFANDVIATIAGLAAVEVKGIAGMSGGIVGGIVEFLGKKNFTKGVKVEAGNEEAAVELFVIVEYGEKIHEVCKAIQRNVKKAIETMTGLKVVSVNVFVQGVYIEKEKKTEAHIETEATPKLK